MQKFTGLLADVFNLLVPGPYGAPRNQPKRRSFPKPKTGSSDADNTALTAAQAKREAKARKLQANTTRAFHNNYAHDDRDALCPLVVNRDGGV